jgi:hypothetical protein
LRHRIAASVPVPISIFLSTVSDEFRTYRDQLRHDLTRYNVEVKVEEDFIDTGEVTLDMLDLYIKHCDLVVHLVGDMTGAAAKPASTQAILRKYPDFADKLPPLRDVLACGEAISYTQWEAWLAIYHGKPLMIAQAAGLAPRDPKYNPTPESRTAQQVHLERLQAMEHYPRCTFGNADQLAKFVFARGPLIDLLAAQGAGAPAGSPYATLVVVGAALLSAPVAADRWAQTLGVTVAAPLVLGLAASLVAFVLTYLRMFSLLGGGSAGSLERQAYDALRNALVTGGHAVQLYTRWLSAFLDWVDRFFGDAGMANRTLFPHAFGLRRPAPLWTASAFDRCLLLALVYPIVTIIVVWAVSGHVGPAEQVLGLKDDIAGWRRGFAVAGIGLSTFATWRGMQATGWQYLLWAIAAAVAFVVGFGFGGVGVVVGGLGVLVVFGVLRSGGLNAGAGAVAVVSTATVVMCLGAVVIGFGGGGGVNFGSFGFVVAGFVILGVALGVVGVLAGFVVSLILSSAINQGRQGAFLSLFLPMMTLACLAAAYGLSSNRMWDVVGPVLLFLGLLTFLNAPFDWASLGLTRALLRRGLELKGWWPFGLALLDALAAAVIIAVLAITMVLGVQLFDTLAVRGGGPPILPLVPDQFAGMAVSETVATAIARETPLLNGLAANPAAPEFWWVYALLISTMVPSLINLAVGGTALVRAAPGVSAWLLGHLPADRAVAAHDRLWIALVLTLQPAAGVILAILTQGVIAYGLIFYAMPAVGLGLLDTARALAKLQLPLHLIQLFAGH